MTLTKSQLETVHSLTKLLCKNKHREIELMTETATLENNNGDRNEKQDRNGGWGGGWLERRKKKRKRKRRED